MYCSEECTRPPTSMWGVGLSPILRRREGWGGGGTTTAPISSSICYPCRSPSTSERKFTKTMENHWKNNVFVMSSDITKPLMKHCKNQHFAARAFGQMGSCPASSSSRCPGHRPQPATKVRNARSQRNAPVAPRGGGSACPGTLQIN